MHILDVDHEVGEATILKKSTQAHQWWLNA